MCIILCLSVRVQVWKQSELLVRSSRESSKALLDLGQGLTCTLQTVRTRHHLLVIIIFHSNFRCWFIKYFNFLFTFLCPVLFNSILFFSNYFFLLYLFLIYFLIYDLSVLGNCEGDCPLGGVLAQVRETEREREWE